MSNYKNWISRDKDGDIRIHVSTDEPVFDDTDYQEETGTHKFFSRNAGESLFGKGFINSLPKGKGSLREIEPLLVDFVKKKEIEFKVGDRVEIIPGTRYENQSSVPGEITSSGGGELKYDVEWELGESNSYAAADLRLVVDEDKVDEVEKKETEFKIGDSVEVKEGTTWYDKDNSLGRIVKISDTGIPGVFFFNAKLLWIKTKDLLHTDKEGPVLKFAEGSIVSIKEESEYKNQETTPSAIAKIIFDSGDHIYQVDWEDGGTFWYREIDLELAFSSLAVTEPPTDDLDQPAPPWKQ